MSKLTIVSEQFDSIRTIYVGVPSLVFMRRHFVSRWPFILNSCSISLSFKSGFTPHVTSDSIGILRGGGS